MSCLLEMLAKGLESGVGQTLERYLTDELPEPLAVLRERCRTHPDRAEHHCRLGLRLLRSLRLKDAAEHLWQACRLQPDYLSARLALAATYDELGMPQQAFEQLQSANQTHAGAPAVLFAVGYCLEKLARSAEAAEYYRDVLAAKDDFLPARQRLAAIALLHDELPLAIEQYEALHRANPGEPATLAALAHLYYRAGRYDEAIAAFETVIAMEPENWALVDDEVEVLVSSGQLREAIDRLYRLLESQGPFADLHLRLAGLLSQTGPDEEALRHFQAALEIDPEYLEARIGLGKHHMSRGRWEEGAEAFLQAAQVNDSLLVSYVGLGVCQSAAGDQEEAINSFQLAAAVEPNSTLLIREMARLQLKAAVAQELELSLEEAESSPANAAEPDQATADASRMDAAEREDLLGVQLGRHQRQVQEHPEYPDLRYRYGVLLRSEGRLTEAEEQFEQAIQLNPSYVDALIRLGITQQELGRMSAAVQTFSRALALRPEYADLHYRLAVLYTDRRKLQEAVEHMEKAAGLSPGNDKIRASLALSLQNMGLMDRAAATWRSLELMHQRSRKT